MSLVRKPYGLGFGLIISITSSRYRKRKVWKGRSALDRKSEKLIRCSRESGLVVSALGGCAFCGDYADYSRVI